MPSDSRLSTVERVLLPLAMLLLVMAQYLNALGRASFLLDDHRAIETQPDVTERAGLARLWGHAADPSQPEAVAQYRPLTVLSYQLTARLSAPGHLEPKTFRWVNLVLLALVGICTAWWLRWVVSPPMAWSASFVLVAHPTNVEAINCISGRAELLAVLGLLIFALQQRWAIQNRRWTLWRGGAALLGAILALGASFTGLLLLPLALAQRWSGHKRRPLPPRRPTKGAAPRPRGPGEPAPQVVAQPPPMLSAQQSHLVSVVTALVVAAALLAFATGRTLALGGHGHAWPDPAAPRWGDLYPNPILELSWPGRIPVALGLAGLYARQLVWPDLSANLIPAELPGWGSLSPWLGAAVIAAGLGALAWAIRRRSWTLIPLALAGGHYLMVSQVLLVLPQYASNRLMLPFTLAAVALLAAVMVTAAATLALSIWVVVLNTGFESDGQMIQADWERQLSNPTAIYRQALWLADHAGNFDKACDHLNEALACRPGSVQARLTLAEMELHRGNRERAASLYREVLAEHPGDSRALAGLEQMHAQDAPPGP